MKKKFRIKKSKEIDAIIKKRKRYGNKFFVVYYKETNNEHLRFAISIGKKYGNSVERNYIKRQIRSIFRKKRNEISEIDYVVVVKPQAKSLNYSEIMMNLENLIRRTQKKEK